MGEDSRIGPTLGREADQQSSDHQGAGTDSHGTPPGMPEPVDAAWVRYCPAPPRFRLRPSEAAVMLSPGFARQVGTWLSANAGALHMHSVMHAARPGRVAAGERTIIRRTTPRDHWGVDLYAGAAELVSIGWWEAHPDGWRVLGRVR